MARLNDAIYLDRALYERVEALDARVAAGELDATTADRYWLETHLRDFVRAGCRYPRTTRPDCGN